MQRTKPEDVAVQKSTVDKMTKLIEEAWARDKTFDKPTLKDSRLKKTIRIEGSFPMEDRRAVCESYQSDGWGQVIHRDYTDAGRKTTTFVFFKDTVQ